MPLTSQQMAVMEKLLDEALRLDEPARRRWLEELAPEYRDLSAALRQALMPDDKHRARLEQFTLQPKWRLDRSDSLPPGLEPGARVGPYELIRLLGAGGMAEVWLARRADGAFKREVALKLPMLTRMRKGLEQRFIRERDILASLEHPNIARLYDAGVDPEGLPYLAMEYVQGRPMTIWCDERRLGIRERLSLFLQVLDAVRYAHEKQVIHRDLKPSNILVTDFGQVRLLDFGVAKLLEDEEAEAAAEPQLTNVYGRALTPNYASPELLQGDLVDARSDIYSLGVLLYEILTGAPPYRLKSRTSLGALGHAIATVEVEKPSAHLEQQAATSRATTQERLARQLRGDLDVITLKALAKESEERYVSAAAMAEDLRRHLHAEPILAQPPRLVYRAGKFVRRHRAGVGVAVAFTLAVAAMVGYEVHRVTEQASGLPAVTNPLGEKSVAVLPFIDMSEKKDQEYFADGLSEELINLLAQVQDLQVIARTSSFYFKGKSATVPQIARTLGVAHILEGSVRKVGNRLRITAQLIRADNGNHLWSQAYDRDDADIFAVQDDIANAVVSALQVKLTSGAQVTSFRGTTNTEAYSQYLLGRQFDQRKSIEGYSHAVDAYRKAIALDPNYSAAYAELAVAEAGVADYNGDTDGIERALHDVDKALVLAPVEANGYAARSLIRTQWMWDWSGAQVDIERALSLDPRNTDVQRRYARLLDALGRLPEAIAAQKKAIELDPLSSNAWENLARYYTDIGDYTLADAALDRALAIAPTSVYALHNLGTARLLQGKNQEALEVFRKLDVAVFRLPGIAMTEHTLGNAKESQRALEELIAKHGQEAAYQIAQALAWCDERDRAFEWLERAYEQRDGGLSTLKTDPTLNSLRADPRFNALVRKMKLPTNDR